jgi:hypothetical protein
MIIWVWLMFRILPRHLAPRKWKPHPAKHRHRSVLRNRQHRRAVHGHFWSLNVQRRRHPAQVALMLLGVGTGITMELVVSGVGGEVPGTTGMRPVVDGSCGTVRFRCSILRDVAWYCAFRCTAMWVFRLERFKGACIYGK